MQKQMKYMLIGSAIIIGAIAAGYFIKQAYTAAVDEAAAKIRTSVREGISEGAEEGISKGVGKGIGNAINPLKLPAKIFGGE